MKYFILRLLSAVAFILLLICAFGMAQAGHHLLHGGSDADLVQFFLCQIMCIFSFCAMNDAQKTVEYRL